jgi:hypothetical protein
MTSETRKHEKAVKKIETAVRKALEKGISTKVVNDTVSQLIDTMEKATATKPAIHIRPARKAPAKKVPVKRASAKRVSAKKAVAKRT